LPRIFICHAYRIAKKLFKKRVKMREEPIKLYLKKLEEHRLEDNLSRPDMAVELGISLKTYGNWYRRTKRKTKPSSKYAGWIKKFLEERGIISADRWIEKDGPNLLT
jgi:DNA-binding transcriptional regulator YiaG